jgi:hypothetical protein
MLCIPDFLKTQDPNLTVSRLEFGCVNSTTPLTWHWWDGSGPWTEKIGNMAQRAKKSSILFPTLVGKYL